MDVLPDTILADIITRAAAVDTAVLARYVAETCDCGPGADVRALAKLRFVNVLFNRLATLQQELVCEPGTKLLATAVESPFVSLIREAEHVKALHLIWHQADDYGMLPVSGTLVSQLLCLTPQLEHFCLRSGDLEVCGVLEQVLSALSSCSCLTSLVLDRCWMPEGASFDKLPRTLMKLHLSYLDSMTQSALNSLLQQGATSLVELFLKSTTRTSFQSVGIASDVLRHLTLDVNSGSLEIDAPRLESLSFRSADSVIRLDTTTVKRIECLTGALRCPVYMPQPCNMTELRLPWGVNKQCLYELLRNCPHLQVAELYRLPQRDCKGIYYSSQTLPEEISILAHLRHVSELSISAENLETLARNEGGLPDFPSVSKLGLFDIHSRDVAFCFKMIRKSPKIVHLTLQSTCLGRNLHPFHTLWKEMPWVTLVLKTYF